jgi:ketosteroid isomerase-like protein
MSTQENLRFIDDWLAALNDNDLDRWVAMHADRVVWHFPESGNTLQGHELVRAAIDSFIARQPDIHFDKIEAFSQGQMVCLEWTEIGTVAETGEPVAYYFLGTLKIEDGKITEVHRYGGKR